MSGKPRPAERLVACPGCGAMVAYSPANPWRPFCSERCRRADLGAWASESYRIPLPEGEPEARLPDEAGGARDHPEPGEK